MFKIKVSGMTCGGCVKSVTNTLLQLDPKSTVDIDLASQTIKIESVKEIKSITIAIEEAGFTVIEAK